MNYHNMTPFWRDNVRGSTTGDEIFTYWDNDTIYGNEGNDTLNGGQGNDLIYGGDDHDLIFGEIGEDDLYGGNGNDTIDGGDFNDVIYGGANNDRLIGGRGSDRAFGGSGDDTFVESRFGDSDLYDGGTGIDTVDYRPDAGLRAKVNVVLADEGQDGSATVFNYWYGGEYGSNGGFDSGTPDILRSIENVRSGNDNDTIIGNSSNNRFESGGGDDRLIGRGGSDTLVGGGGNDTYVYEARTDSAPVTSFLSRTSDFSTTDLIIGFGDSAGNQDIIDLRAIDADTRFTRPGDNAFFLDNGDATASVGELRFLTMVDQDQGGREVSVLAADTNGDFLYDFAIRFDRVVTTFSNDDFLL